MVGRLVLLDALSLGHTRYFELLQARIRPLLRDLLALLLNRLEYFIVGSVALRCKVRGVRRALVHQVFRVYSLWTRIVQGRHVHGVDVAVVADELGWLLVSGAATNCRRCQATKSSTCSSSAFVQ